MKWITGKFLIQFEMNLLSCQEVEGKIGFIAVLFSILLIHFSMVYLPYLHKY